MGDDEDSGGGKAIAAIALACVLVVALPIVLVAALTGTVIDKDQCGTGPQIMAQGVSGPTGVTLAGLSERQLAQARNVVAIGKKRNLPESVIKANLYAEATESSYRNLANPNVPESLTFPHDGEGTDHDSVGPNQLRAGIWGSVGMATLMNPTYQINWFYDQAVKIPGYEHMDSAELSQAVERSGPNAYSKSVELGNAIFEKFKDVDPGETGTSASDGGASPSCAGESSFTPGGPFGQNVIAAAKKWLGTPYSWGGGNQYGPTFGISDGGGAGDAHGDTTHKGFDCSGLTLYAVYAASGGKILLPHFTGDHSNPGQLYDPRGKEIPLDQKQPGDLIYFGAGGNTHHVGIYYGKENGQDMLLNAPESGKTVSIMPLSSWNGEQMYVRRFG